MRILTLCLVALATALPSATVRSDVTFQKTILDPDFRSEGVAIADVNKDGKTDVIVGDLWYEAPNWNAHEIRKPRNPQRGGYTEAFAVYADDFNEDGWQDVLVIPFHGKDAKWYENPKGASGHWKERVAFPRTGNETRLYLDLFGDGEKVFLMSIEDHVAWIEVPPAAKINERWKVHRIAEDKTCGHRFAHGLGTGDVNGDGRKDILSPKGWWEQPAAGRKHDGLWKFHRTEIGNDCADMYVFDADGDGRNDIISTSAHQIGIWFHQQTGDPKEPTFKTYTLDKSIKETHSLNFIDVNGDGKKDLVTGWRFFAHGFRPEKAGMPSELAWFEILTTKGAPPTLRKHSVDMQSGVGAQFVTDDINQDGKLDIIVSNRKGVFVFQQTGKPTANASPTKRGPNFVVIFLDDSGWNDFPPFGKPKHKTPNVAKLANDGTAFRQFYVPQAICSASRAALLTGCYPGRTKMFGAHGPKARGLDPRFATIAEVLKPKGYKSAIFGKWHVGDQETTRPLARGFDENSGLMYSNDMWEYHPEHPKHWGRFPLQFWNNGKVTIERVTPQHQTMLTTWYTEHAVDFIARRKDEPFFLYVPHSMPHVPLYVSEKFRGKSGTGVYGDVMMEIDWSVGEIIKALDTHGLSDNTLVLFTSDNGPWISYGDHAGSTPFREAKGTSFDGGVRSACIAKFPGKIPAGKISQTAFSTLDFLPTIAQLAGAPLPKNPVDGKNVWDILAGKAGAKNPNEYYPFSNGSNFEGVISADGRWKLHVPHRYRTLVQPAHNGAAGRYRQAHTEMALFDMQADPYESKNVLAERPEIGEKLLKLAKAHRARFYPPKKNRREKTAQKR